MPKPKQIASLKLDFKIDDRGIVRIIDLGDGFGCGLGGFDDTELEAKMLCDIHNATGAAIATVFGELPFHAMRPESMSIPLVFREHPSAGHSLNANDLPSEIAILPYSQVGRLASSVSLAWGKEKDKVMVAPAGLMALEMHKILWYFLMQKHIPLMEQQKVLYWSNDTNPTEINLDAVDLRFGVFIKIADRSMGGGEEVHYASNKKEILAMLTELHKKYKENNKEFKKHMFVIEPAYVTVKQHQGKDYNVTGRAFVSLIYDQDKQTLEVKIAAAKWMFALEPMRKERTQNQMLSNVKHSIKMLHLTAEELEVLSSGMLHTYGETFKAGFANNNLISYCTDHPNMPQFISCLRPKAAYSLVLDAFYCSPYDSRRGQNFLKNIIACLVDRDFINGFYFALDQASLAEAKFFTVAVPELNNLMKGICFFSFFENYVAHLKVSDPADLASLPFPRIADLIKKEVLIKSTLNRMILQYLSLKNNHYDIKDTHRALRQAAAVGDITVIKLLIYTRRADVNALSPTNKTALDCAHACTCIDETLKQQVLRLLENVSAQTGEQLMATSRVYQSQSCSN